MKQFWLLTVLAALVVSAAGCSKDGVGLATYTDGKTTFTVKIGDVKKDLMMYVQYNPQIAVDATWHKSILMDRYIVPEIIYFDRLSKGFTNTPEFASNYKKDEGRQRLMVMYQKGVDLIEKQSKENQYEVARASHILLRVNDSTNIDGKVVNLTAEQIAAGFEEANTIALNMIDALGKAKDLGKEFSNLSISKSQDPGSAYRGGDLDFFTRGMMVKEFEDAVFTAKGKGLVSKPVRTQYGIHVIYVTVPAQKKNSKDLEGIVGKQKYQRLAGQLQQGFMQEKMTKGITRAYEVTSNAIVFGGRSYAKPSDIDDAAQLVTVGKTPYTWKDVKEVVGYFVPDFSTNMSVENTGSQIKNFENFMFFVEIAREAGYDKSDDFKKEMTKQTERVLKNMALTAMENELREKAEKEMTPDNLKKYYESMKDSFTKEVTNGGKVTNIVMNYKEAEKRVTDEFRNNMLMQYFEEWKANASTQYKVTYLENGIKDLMALEKAEVDAMNKKRAEAEKKRQEDMKKNQQNNPGQQQPQQPIQLPNQ